MKQLLQSLRTGQIECADVPCPALRPGHVLIRTRRSLISPGTERSLVEFGRKSLVAKATSQPEKVRQVLDKLRTDGVLPTLEAVFRRLDEPLPLGYCNAGVVLATGAGVDDLAPGDRVASNGAHADIVCVPRTLCAKIPAQISDDQACFTVLSSIALQGIRLLEPTLGERVAVVGLGLIGLVAVQLLRASGCEVLGLDLDERRLALAERFGATTLDPLRGGDPVRLGQDWSAGHGVDGVLICASSSSDAVMRQAAGMCRKRGRIVLVGVVGLNLQRDDFYEKELSFQVSCSYGPGRYDESYEQQGRDYPFAYVRWTEQRNFQAVLQAMAHRTLAVDELVTHRFEREHASAAYDVVRAGAASALGVVLSYPDRVEHSAAVTLRPRAVARTERAVVGVIGAGNFANATLLPALVKTAASLAYVADPKGHAARHAARRFGAEQAVTDYRRVLDDPAVDGVFIAVGHHLHARIAVESLRAGKHTFVEKPLALSAEELSQVATAAREHPERLLLVGFNRRFSAHTRRVRQLLRGRSEPLCMTLTVNAGALPAAHWLRDPARGGGRVVGEACHFVDLLAFLCGSPVTTVAALRPAGDSTTATDSICLSLRFADGSLGNVNYFAGGSRGYPKEELLVFSEGRVVRLNNFRRTTGFGFNGFRSLRTLRQDKGHAAQFREFVERMKHGGEQPIALDDLLNTSRACLAAVEAAAGSRTIVLAHEDDAGERPGAVPTTLPLDLEVSAGSTRPATSPWETAGACLAHESGGSRAAHEESDRDVGR